MNIYNYQAAFGASDKTSPRMRSALKEWFDLYYQQPATHTHNPCQRIAYTVVNKITKGVFGEYQSQCADPVADTWRKELEGKNRQAMQLTLMGGECYIKPCPTQAGFSYTLIPRNNLLIFARDSQGMPTDVGIVERSCLGRYYYTLLERRTWKTGRLTVENKLYRAYNRENLGQQVALSTHPEYRSLPETWECPLSSVGLVQLRTPMVNCVDGSSDGVAIFAPATQLIQAIDRNEAQLMGEFDRGESRILVSRDLLDKDKNLSENLFVGLDEDPEQVGITIFSPQLREQSYLARKQEYLRNVESVVGLKRGMLSDANMEERTATEITASNAEYALTVMDFQRLWQQAVEETMALCHQFAKLFGMQLPENTQVSFTWGNGVLYDEEATWSVYMDMVARGLLAPEVALGWRFHLPAQTSQERAVIRRRYMPGGEKEEE